MFNCNAESRIRGIIFFYISLPGLQGTIRISKLFNDTNKVNQLMVWWSSNVQTRISNLQQQNDTELSEGSGNASISSDNQTIKGKLVIYLHSFCLIFKSITKKFINEALLHFRQPLYVWGLAL